MFSEEREESQLRSVAFQTANSIQFARLRAEQGLLEAKAQLEAKTAELAQSLSLLRATLDSTADGILVVDSEMRITGFNQPFVQMWNVPAGIMDSGQQSRLLEFVQCQVIDPEGFLLRVKEIYDSGPSETEDILELRDGRVFERISRTQFVEGRAIGRVWSFRDVTERERGAELRNRLAAIVQSSDDSIISKRLDGTILTWNRGAERMFGYQAEEIVGQTITTLIPPDRVDEEAEIIAKIRNGEGIEHFESERLRKDGTLIDVSLTISPVRDGKDRIVGASHIARDITARKKGEAALQEERKILELLNKTGAAIASTLDLQELIQLVTDSGTHLSGAKFGAFFYNVVNEEGEAFQLYTLSGAPREAFEKFGLPRNTPVFEPTFRGKGVVRLDDVTKDPRYGTMEPHHGMPKGHLPVRSYLAVPVVSRSGEVIGGLFFGHPEAGRFDERSERLIVGIAAQAAVAIDNARLYEETKRISIEREKLLDAERAARSAAERVSVMKDEFLANVSHELRTPLNAILGWSQLLNSKKLSEADFQQGLETIQRNARAQSQLIGDLLDMSRIVSGKVRLDIQQTELARVVEEAIASVRPSADVKEIRLRQIIDPDVGAVSGDPTRLQQVVWNLLTNAVKFTPQGGRVEVVLQRVNSHVEIVVTDSGQGIKPDFLPHVFERFRQADASTTRMYGGLGLGLAIVKQLVEMHGGTVSAYSEGVGKGSSFTVCLPLAPLRHFEGNREHPTTPTDNYLDCTGIDIHGIKVLVVDDETDARELIRRMLEDCKAQVVCAATAKEGMDILQSTHPDVILSDIGMPGVDGYEFIRQVRALPPSRGGRTPAAALTAFARTEDRTRAMIAGYQIHIAKPIEPQELLAAVASLVRRMGTASN